MGSPSATGGGRTDAGPNRTTATKIGVGNITESGKKLLYINLIIQMLLEIVVLKK
ncbi:hypothetical protein [uncultured phage MedDCM-OCT-S04-C1161]|nr:hypothetical protein [uncultured phage MedDCM-OCT-S04-C1035]ADD94122.1 hypothetical protein [uncultured phage MedDCM-OCT-S04-C1161]ADD94179.1 hypothetical protein [uncultured phage MedDCM-OCT-S04-C1201]